MKHLLNKKLHVKHVAAFIVLPLGAALVVLILLLKSGTNPATVQAKTAESKEVPPVKANPVHDTSALGLLNSYVDSLNTAGQLFGGSWSFYLTELNSGKAICSVNIDQGLSPASVMKIVTTGTALTLLGPDFRFSTLLQYNGTIDSASMNPKGGKIKILNGNIFIKGEGDPSLGSEVFGSSVADVMKEWAGAIKKMGIDSIAGNIIADGQSYESNPVPQCWTWEDMQCDYGTGPGGLNIHENIFDMLVTPDKHGTSLKLSPAIPGLKLYNEIIHNPSVPKSYVFVVGAPFQFERTAMGEVSAAMVGKSAIPDPALFCAESLKSELCKNGIGVRDTPTTLRQLRLNQITISPNQYLDSLPLKKAKKDSRKLILEDHSPTLAELVYHTNQVSQNFYAESILRGLAWKLNGFGSDIGGIDIIYHFWKTKGLDLRGLCMADGCGLARMNTITTHQIVGMLREYAQDSAIFPAFYKSLPVAGESGTIRKLADGTEADGNLHAKSGTMARVKAYAGYVRAHNGKMLCFAMIGNNTLWSEAELSGKFARLFVLMARLN